MTRPLELGRKCRTCGNTEGWHLENRPRHPFVNEDSDGPDGLGPRKERDKGQDKVKTRVQVRDQPTDLALRIALMQKGLLSQAEIAAADTLLREAIEGGNVIVVGAPTGPIAGDASGQRDNKPSSSADAALGHGGGAPRGLRASDWPTQLERSSHSSEDQEHRRGAEDVVEDGYGLGDAPPVPGYHKG